MAPAERPGGRPTTALTIALVVVAVLVAFGPAVGGSLVWDDATVVGAAAALPSPLAAFHADLFALGDASAGAGASYWRPLVSASFWLDAHASPLPVELSLHLTNLAWQALATWLVARALARWIACARPATSPDRVGAAALVAALVWAVLPLKAENVAWISGRGDVMGLALLLAGLELRRAARGRVARVALAVVATLAALLAKEAFVAACVIVAVEVAAERAAERAPLVRAALSPDALASAVVGVAYLAVRSRVLRVHGGGEAMFAGLDVADRVGLFLESVGHATRALALPTRPALLRGPIGFSAPLAPIHEPGHALLGALAIAAGLLVAARVRAARAPLGLLAGALLPVSNLVPTGLESRMSDRFLYVPSLGLALGLAVALSALDGARARRALAATLVAALVLTLLTGRRSALFRSDDALFSYERVHGDRATSVLLNAGSAAIRARRYAEARDLRVEGAQRFAELGFAPEGFPLALEAARLDVLVAGEAHAASYGAYARALAALVEGRAEEVDVPLSSGAVVRLSTGAPEARAYAAERRPELAARLLVIAARAGSDASGAAADALVSRCEDACAGVTLAASRVHLALLRPARARELVARIPRPSRDAEDLESAAALVERALARVDALGGVARAQALFAAEAYRRACVEGAAALTPETRGPDRAVVTAACRVAGEAGEAARIAGEGPDPAPDPSALRLDPSRRAALLSAALP
jgi:hypothetical protein